MAGQEQDEDLDRPVYRQAESEYEPIKYGDVFDVTGELANKPIAPEDAAALKTAEKQALGMSLKGSPADIMMSAAEVNVRTGLVSPGDAAINQGVRIEESDVSEDRRVVSEVVGDQVLGQYVGPKPVEVTARCLREDSDVVTIGEALETVAVSDAGDKPVTQSDAAAIKVAEKRSTGKGEVVPGGLGDEAQAAADRNALAKNEDEKITLADLLGDANTKLSGDKPATRRDAEAVITAELKSNPQIYVAPGGVGESMAAAARLNQD